MIDAQKATFTIARMAELLQVSRSGYCAWAQRRAAGPGMRELRRLGLVGKIEAAHEALDGVNAAPRITADLRAVGEVISVKTTAKLMRQRGIRGISPRPWRPVTTIVDPNPHVIPDLVGRRFDQGVVNTVWTSDITYLTTGEGWLYLCAVRDGCSRRVLGYAFSGSLHTDVVEDALRRAVAFGEPDTGTTTGVIFHADGGCQYTSAQLARVADDLEVRLSVGRTGVCYDNAQQESFCSTLKIEFYTRHVFATHAEAIHAVSSWIETVYNRRRRHSALGQISPVAFEHRLTTAAAEAA